MTNSTDDDFEHLPEGMREQEATRLREQEVMRSFWEGMGVSEKTGIRRLQEMGWMDARGSLTELGVAGIQALLREVWGAKPS